MKFISTFKKGYISLFFAVLAFGGFVTYATNATMNVDSTTEDFSSTSQPQEDFVASTVTGASVENIARSASVTGTANVVSSVENAYRDQVTAEVVVAQKDDEQISKRDDRQRDRQDDDYEEENEDRGDREERENDDD